MGGRHRARHHRARHRHGRKSAVATVITAAVAVGGVGAVGYALAAQQVAPQPTVAAAGTLRPGAPPESLPTEPSAGPGENAPVLAAAEPTAINIPAIGVESTLEQVGLRPDGSIEVPAGSNYDEPAWYRHSPTPGELGPSVILGHVDSAARGPSVFFRLGELEPGDTISVARRDGTTAVFEVDAVRSYSKDRFPTRKIYGNTDHAALRLITCGGDFNQRTGLYTANIVAFAHLVTAQR